MSNIPSILPVAQQPAGTAPSQAVIPAPPPGLAQLSAGTLIEGTVIGRTQQGLLAVKTSHGELALRTAASPPAQSRVVLQLQPSGGQFRVILLTAHAGAKTQGPPAQNAAPPPGGQQAGSQSLGGATQARVSPPTVGSPPPAQGQAQAQSGGAARNTLSGSPAPQSGAVPQRGGQPASQPQVQPPVGQQAGAAPPASGQPAALPATLSAPAVLAAQTSAPAPTAGVPAQATGAPATPLAPGAPQTAAPANPAAPTAAGAQSSAPALTTPAHTPGAVPPPTPGAPVASPAATGAQIGQALLSPGAPLANALGNPLPLPSSTLSTSIGPLPAGAAPQASAPLPAPLSAADLARGWPGLDQAVAALRAASPQIAAPNIDAVMPKAGPQLAGGLALLISALRGGDIRGWLGHGTMREFARVSGKDAANRLSDEFGQLSRLARTDSGEWRVHALPFFDGARHQQIQLYLKNRDESGTDGEDIPARFVFEFELSKLGPVQLDGLAANHRFDLVVRSQQDLPEAIRKEISALFSRSQEESGFAGEIHFQTVPAFTVAPLADVQPNAGNLVV